MAMLFVASSANALLLAQAPTYSGGTGTAEDPFQISTPEDLLALSTTEAEVHWVDNTNFKLMNDIDMADITGMLCIGYEYTNTSGVKVIKQFEGNFDGNNKVIRNLSISESRTTTILIGHGLFGNIIRGEVKNLGLINPYVNVLAERAGALIGNAAQTTVENCFIIGGSVEGQTKVGGIMGKPNWGTTVKNCFSNVEIRARYIKNGGIFGDIDNVTETCLFENLAFYGEFGWSEVWNKQTEGNPGFGFTNNATGRGNAENPDISKNIYTIIQGTPDYSTVTTKMPLELAEQATYAGFDFTEGTGQWVMKQNSFAVLQGFGADAFNDLTTFRNLPLKVLASDNTTPIAGATVTIDEQTYTTNADGEIDALFYPGVYDYVVTKTDYQENSGSVNTESEEFTYVVFLRNDESSYDITLKFIKGDGTALEGVSVNITDGDLYNTTILTDADGMISINNILAKDYTYTATKDLFITKTDVISVTQNEDFEITLDKDNQAPVAEAGVPITVASGDVVILDAYLSSDANGDALTFTWEAVDNDIVLEATEEDTDRARMFTAPDVSETTVYTFKVTASDGELSSESEIAVTVKGALFSGVELMINGSFENGLAEGWTGLDGKFATSEDVADNALGTKSIIFDTDTSQIGGYHNSPTEIKNDLTRPLIIGRSYVLRGKVKAVNMSMNVINLRIMPQNGWYDGAKLGLTRPTVTWGKELTLNEWIEFEKIIEITPEFTTDPNDGNGDEVLSKLNIYPSPRQDPDGSTPNDIFYLDDLSITEFDADIMLSAGEDQEVRTGSTANLTGSYEASDMLTTIWASNDGLTITDADKMNATFVVPQVTEDTEYVFTFSATKALRTETTQVVYTAIPNAVASAGADQEVEAETVVTLDATASLPANVSLKWTNEHEITLDDDESAQPTFTAPLVDQSTDFTFTLTASYKGMEVTDEVVITVLPVTRAVAGDNITAQSGDVVTLDGSASTPDNLTYAWTTEDGIELTGANTATPSFTAPTVTMRTDYTFTLTVTSETSITDTDEVTVSIYPVIVADAGEDQMVMEGATVNVGGSNTTDSNVTYVWTASDENLTLTNADQKMASFTAPNVDELTEITLTLTVTYDEDFNQTDEVVVTVYPEITANAGADQSAMSASTVTLDGSQSTSGVTYAWTSSDESITITDADQATASFMAPEVEQSTEITFTLTVSDQNGQTAADDVLVTVYPQVIAAAGDDMNALEGSTVTLDGSASSENKTYAWTSSDENITITNADQATATFTAPEVDANTEITFTLTVSDEFGQSVTDQVTVTVYSTIAANAGADQTASAGDNVTLDGSQSSANVTYAWTSSDENITITSADQATASFTAPEVTESTEITFTLTVSDEFGQTVSDQVVVTVLPMIVANAGEDKSATAGDNVTLDGSASTANATYEWTSSDENITITDADKATASFTAPEVTEETEITFTLKVTDSFGQMTTDEVIVTVIPQEIPTSVDPSTSKVVSAYPNPTTDIVTIEVTQNATAQVLNANGQLLQTVTLLNGENSIDLSSYNVGIYFVNIQTNDSVEVVKIIKK